MRQAQGHPKHARLTHRLDAGDGGHPACHENDDVARPFGEPVTALGELDRKADHVRVHRTVGALELLTQPVIHLTDNGGGGAAGYVSASPLVRACLRALAHRRQGTLLRSGTQRAAGNADDGLPACALAEASLWRRPDGDRSPRPRGNPTTIVSASAPATPRGRWALSWD